MMNSLNKIPGAFPVSDVEEEVEEKRDDNGADAIEAVYELPGTIPAVGDRPHSVLTGPFDPNYPRLEFGSHPVPGPVDEPAELHTAKNEPERPRPISATAATNKNSSPAGGGNGSRRQLKPESQHNRSMRRSATVPLPSSHRDEGTGGRLSKRVEEAPSRIQPVPKNGEQVIAVFGMTGTGKSTFINKLTGANVKIGHNLHSMTSEIQEVPFTLGGRKVAIVDTPGFDDTEVSNTETLMRIASWLKDSYSENTLTGIIYLHRVSDNRMSGSSYRNLALFRSLCGRRSLSNVILATTMWDKVSLHEGERRERNLLSADNFWGSMVNSGALVRRHDNTTAGAEALVGQLLTKKPTTLRIQREMVLENKELFETTAGQSVNDQLTAMAAEHKKELQQVKEDFQKAIKEKDKEWISELQEYEQKLEKSIEEKAESMSKLRNPLVTTKPWYRLSYACQVCGERRVKRNRRKVYKDWPCPKCKTPQTWV